MIIDTQVHVFPQIPYFGNINRKYSPDLLVALMDNAEVDKAILISYELKDMIYDAELYGNADRKIISKKYFVNGFRKFPDRFIWFTYGFDPKNKDYLDIVKGDVANGARGIKLFPTITNFSLDDPGIESLFEYCQEKHLPVILANECWNHINRWPYTNDFKEYSLILSRLVEKYRGIKWLFCHLGCFNWSETPGNYLAKPEEVYKNIDEFIELLAQPNVWTDIAAIAWCYDEPYPYLTAQKLIKRLVNEIGIEKFLFGTDWPWSERYCTYKQMVDIIRYADFLTDNQKEKFLGINAANFLELER